MPAQRCSPPIDVVYLPVAEWRQALPRLRYGCVEKLEEGPDGLMTGFVSFGDDGICPRLWIGWNWAEFMPGVVAQADAQDLRTSVRFLDAGGRPLRAIEQFQELQTALFLLSWWRHIDLDWFRPSDHLFRQFELPGC